jgi:thiamine monophosphate synthase
LIRLDNEIKEFKQELFKISWYMRGGVTVSQLLEQYSYEDRGMIYNVIKENVEATKETRMPLL